MRQNYNTSISLGIFGYFTPNLSNGVYEKSPKNFSMLRLFLVQLLAYIPAAPVSLNCQSRDVSLYDSRAELPIIRCFLLVFSFRLHAFRVEMYVVKK